MKKKNTTERSLKLLHYCRKRPLKSKEVLGGTSARYESTAVYCQKSEIRKAIRSPQAPKHHESPPQQATTSPPLGVSLFYAIAIQTNE